MNFYKSLHITGVKAGDIMLMLWSLLIFSFHVLASSGHCFGLQQASWDIFTHDLVVKPANHLQILIKASQQISSPSCPTTKPMMSAPTNDAVKGIPSPEHNVIYLQWCRTTTLAIRKFRHQIYAPFFLTCIAPVIPIKEFVCLVK